MTMRCDIIPIKRLLLFVAITMGISGANVSAQDDYFSTESIWISDQANDSYCIAVGDVNLDGYLDVVFGNKSQKNTLYLNNGGTLATTPAWQSFQSNGTYSVALGDVDGDGDLDLVCGNYSGAINLYRNVGGPAVFEVYPAWTSGITMLTQEIVLGDVDNDGDLDLVCANGALTGLPRYKVNRLYLNNGETFESTPAWESADSLDTRALALGDIDGNGYLDVAFGNSDGSGSANTVYLNYDGMFEATPSWRSSDELATQAIALGDMNGDGYLDLLCGNGEYAGQKNVLYVNAGGMLETTPSWQTDETVTTHSMTIGDVEGDGDLDVLFADATLITRLYVNDGGVLHTTADWQITTPGQKQRVSLGDMDADGDLDLLFAIGGPASSNPFNILLNNITPVYTNVPDWTSDDERTTVGIAFGDIDNDGDLDLVCSNGVGYAPEPNRDCVYLNDRGRLSTAPGWESDDTFGAGHLELEDLNRDGFVDFVGIFGGGYRYYLNVGGTFQTTSTLWAENTWYLAKFAMGDVDRNGRPDLVSAIPQPNSIDPPGGIDLFLNNNESEPFFPVSPNWFIRFAGFTKEAVSALVLADINLDGNLDMICGMSDSPEQEDPGYSNHAYLGNGIVFSSTPEWISRPAESNISVAIGDVNGDGYLDLACGNVEKDHVYLGNGTSFEIDPAWSSGPVSSSAKVYLKDWDGDGDLDLMCLQAYGVVNWYFNDGGGIEIEPGYTIDIDNTTPGLRALRGIAVGDVDGDGDFDLALATGYQLDFESNGLLRGKKQPPYKGDPENPTHSLPNNGAWVRWVTLDPSGDNFAQIQLEAVDVESDPVWILLNYQFEGNPTWFEVDVPGETGAIGPLASSPEGTPHSFDWNILQIPFDHRDIVLRIRTVSAPSRVSEIQSVATHLSNVGRLTPSRPEITVPSYELVFPTVTVGDTTCLDLVIMNTGTGPLSIESISLPSIEMAIGRSFPFVVPAGDSDTVSVCIQPCQDLEIAGPLTITSSDPLKPTTTVNVASDVRALEFKSTLLSETEILPLGDAVSVMVAPAPDVQVEYGFLYYRSSGRAAFADSVALSANSLGFAGIIPGEHVTETGIDYYVRVVNDCVETTDPPGAPEACHHRWVEPPVSLTTTPVPTGEQGFLEGRSIRVAVGLPQGTEFVSGMLHCREGAAHLFVEVPFALEEDLPFATIPDSLVAERGVEYWAEIQTATTTLTDPPNDPEQNPYALQVIVDDLEERLSYPGERFRMVSVPMDFGGDFTGSLLSILSDQHEFGPYDPMQWRCFRYSREDGAYRELSSEGDDELFYLAPERGFWLISRDTHRISTAPITGTSVSTEGPYEITLEPGWNQIGHPFVFAVDWDSMAVDSLTAPQAVDSGIIQTPVGWSEDGMYDYEIDNMYPFYAYWIKNLSSSPVVLAMPPVEAIEEATQPPPDQVPDGEDTEEWTIRIIASSVGAHDAFNLVGINKDADASWDPRDRAEAPMGPGRMLSLYFPHSSWKTHPGAYTTDIRSGYIALDANQVEALASNEIAWGQAWRFDVGKTFTDNPVGDEVELEFDGLSGVPAEAGAHLIDHEMRQVVNLRDNNRYAFYLAESDVVAEEIDTRFTLVIGSETFVGDTPLPPLPTSTALHQNYPNPFNPTTLIKYDIASAGKVSVRVFDASGALVRDLYSGHRMPGRYVISWHGDNQAGHHVASGVYFYRLESPTTTKTKKMVMLK